VGPGVAASVSVGPSVGWTLSVATTAIRDGDGDGDGDPPDGAPPQSG
jgi:hypothetical protein